MPVHVGHSNLKSPSDSIKITEIHLALSEANFTRTDAKSNRILFGTYYYDFENYDFPRSALVVCPLATQRVLVQVHGLCVLELSIGTS